MSISSSPPSDGPLRCFAALVLPDDLRRRIRASVETTTIDTNDLTPPEKYHLTLRFAGTVDESGRQELERIAARVAAEHPPLTLALSGAGTFPEASVLWLGIDGDLTALESLWRSIQTASDGVGDAPPPAWDDPEFRFRPHLTVAHLQGVDAQKREEFVEQLAALGLADSWQVSAFGLFATMPDGSYHRLGTYDLSG